MPEARLLGCIGLPNPIDTDFCTQSTTSRFTNMARHFHALGCVTSLLYVISEDTLMLKFPLTVIRTRRLPSYQVEVAEDTLP